MDHKRKTTTAIRSHKTSNFLTQPMARHVYRSYRIFALCVILLNVCAGITFGHGLGDGFYMIAMGVSILAMWGIYRVVKNFRIGGWILLILTLFIATRVALKASIYRGPECQWNGRIFFPLSR